MASDSCRHDAEAIESARETRPLPDLAVEYADESISPSALDAIDSSWDIYGPSDRPECQRIARFRDLGPAWLLSALASNMMGVKVSTMSNIYSLREFEGVSLALVPRPRAGDWLRDEIDSWRNANIRTVVSLLESQGIAELNIEDEAQVCASCGIEFISFPIRDRGVASSYGALSQLIVPLLPKVRGGLTVVVHCRAGIGRSGLVAGSILVRAAIPYFQVFPALSRARGLAVPDTDAQAEWVRTYAQSDF